MNGILFKPDMIKAILRKEKPKIVTRRLGGLDMNFDPNFVDYIVMDNGLAKFRKVRNARGGSELPPLFNRPVKMEQIDGEVYFWYKPRYKNNEIVHLKEAHCIECFKKDGIKDACFKTDEDTGELISISLCTNAKWRSPLFLPAEFARHFIKIKDVRAERLQRITEEDILKEGCPKIEASTGLRLQWYKTLWDKINPQFPFSSNPYIFRYEFTLTEKPSEHK